MEPVKVFHGEEQIGLQEMDLDRILDLIRRNFDSIRKIHLYHKDIIPELGDLPRKIEQG